MSSPITNPFNLVMFQFLLAGITSVLAATEPKLFREYIGAEGKNLTFSDVPINSNVEFHFILSFAIDYTDSTSPPNPTNGDFKPYWDTQNLCPSHVSSIKSLFPNVKVALSLGGDTVAGYKVFFKPTSVNSWLRNAIYSITQLVQSNHLDGIDIDYEHFDADPDIFADCIGKLIYYLKQSRIVSFASIAPYDDEPIQSHYLALWRKYGHLIDYVNFQFYAYSNRTTIPEFMGHFERQVKNYRGGKVLVSFGTDDSGGLKPDHGFFEACTEISRHRELHGIFIWSADDSKKFNFSYEIQSQTFLTTTIVLPPRLELPLSSVDFCRALTARFALLTQTLLFRLGLLLPSPLIRPSVTFLLTLLATAGHCHNRRTQPPRTATDRCFNEIRRKMYRARAEGLTFTKEPYIEDVGPRRIKSMQFTALSDSEISRIAEVQVAKGSYYDERRKPIENGLLDPHMGPANKSCTCATCHGSFVDCPGHYGYLNLALPVFNVGYKDKILQILKCICKGCARILLDENSCKERLKKMRSPKIEPLRKIAIAKSLIDKCSAMTSSKTVKCLRCGFINGPVKKLVSNLGIIHDTSKCIDGIEKDLKSAVSTRESASTNSTTYVLNPHRVLSLFKRMLDEDCELLDLADRPEKFITTNMAVPPIAIRPSVIMDGSQSNENDATERLRQIIQANANLRHELQEASGAFKSLDGWEILQVEAAQFINSDVRGIPFNMQRAKPLAGFVQRLKGKQGRFRGNLSGKRVEFTGRTVISPDPNLKISEVAIPIHMARILTFPECVSPHNIEKLRQCVRNGPDKYPGARLLRHAGGTSRSLKVSFRKRLADELRYGDIVDRHLEDGDIVLFNRQPSLHRMSIMCHRARVMPWRTLRFNESVCNPYNADFDGDEMNLHVPQTEEARTEAILLMGVPNNLCTPKNGEILVASTQDFLTSSFLITRKDTFYDRSACALICSYMGDAMDIVDLPTPAIIKPVELWSGKQIFSVLIRSHANVRTYVSLTVKEKTYSTKLDDRKRELKTICPNDGFVYFRNSELISGQLGKVTLGNGNKDGLFSVLLRDYKAHAAASCMNRLAKLSARWIGNRGFSIGIDDVQPKEELIKKKDETISDNYRKCDNFIEAFNKGKLELKAGCDAAQTLEALITSVLNGIRDTAGKVCMQTLHWRNSPLIMSQCGSKGSPINISQMVACVGQQSVGGRRAPNGFMERSLPHFPRKAKTPAAKGFVANSFYSGLSATEFFFHTMGGREGLVDTAVKTADTGYMSRRLIKALEDLFVHYDNTVRNASSCVVQFCYGDDAMDPAGMEGKNGKPLNFERLFLKSKAICPSDGDDEILSSSDACKVVQDKLSKFGMLKEKGASEDDISSEVGCSADFINCLQSFIRDNIGVLSERDETSVGDDSRNQKKFIQRISGITSRQLEVFLDICLSRYHSKSIEAGTPIGAIGAQSIGEPGTQMTLKTFHFAGVASMNVTLGVPRIKEIINGAKRISTPIITAILESDDNANTARMVKGRIEKTNLGQIAKGIKIVMTSRSATIVITLDMEIIRGAQLNIDANIVRESILHAPKLKLKPEHINVLDVEKLAIVPQDADRSKINFQLNHLKNLLPSVVVKGIKTAERVVISKEEDKETKMEKFKLLVEGTGLQEVMGIEGVNGSKTLSNHIIEVEQTLGIEAARKCIIEEIKFTMGSHGMSIDIRHMMLLADVMTFRGEVLGITRFGIQKMDKSVLMLASFEKTADHLFNASVHGRDDQIEGVTECIIMGTPIQIGTGMIKVKQRLDPPALCQGADPILS